ncbi:MAG: response regulator transcription factor [Sphaerochaetaceae bacterium]|nr:response regulator transcription factor [Sphaerochaetaceae bacterium]
MNGFLLFTYTASIAISCMTLALAIASRILHSNPWNGKFIVFQSMLIGILVMALASKLSLFFMPQSIYRVFKFIFNTLMIGSMSFVIVFLPYFLGWVIARPWRRAKNLVFFPMAIVYLGVGIASFIVESKVFDFWAVLAQTLIVLGMYIYCIVVLWVNLKNIDDKPVRNICLTINIVSLSLIPLSILSVFFSVVSDFSYPIYILAFSIVALVYLFVRFGIDRQEEQNKPTLDYESLQRYKISEREFSVVKLICEGMTNKEIAQELSISVNTVNNHVANIFNKMEVRSRIDLLKILKEGPWS